MNTKITKDLIKIRKNLKRKFASLTSGRIAHAHTLEETFKPIVNPIKELTNVVKLQKSDDSPKKLENIKSDESFITLEKFKKGNKETLKTPKREYSDFQSFMTSSPNPTSSFSKIDNFGDITLIKETNNNEKFDKSYGPYFDIYSNTRRLGNSSFNIDEKTNDIIIDGEIFRGTDGLHELIFKKKPENYTQDDLYQYRNILDKTNAHRRNYDSSEQLKGSKGFKYKNIISKLYTTHEYNTRGRKTGKTLTTHANYMLYSKNPIQYTYWDDPNELVDRLRFLIASESAGNNNHHNEINSIIEELREANIIE